MGPMGSFIFLKSTFGTGVLLASAWSMIGCKYCPFSMAVAKASNCPIVLPRSPSALPLGSPVSIVYVRVRSSPNDKISLAMALRKAALLATDIDLYGTKALSDKAVAFFNSLRVAFLKTHGVAD